VYAGHLPRALGGSWDLGYSVGVGKGNGTGGVRAPLPPTLPEMGLTCSVPRHTMVHCVETASDLGGKQP